MITRENTLIYTLVPFPTEESVYTCSECGALIYDVDAHSKFHSNIMYARDPRDSK